MNARYPQNRYYQIEAVLGYFKYRVCASMKLARYRVEGEGSYGALVGDKIIPLPKLAKHQGIRLPVELDSIINLATKHFEKASLILMNASKKDLEEISIPLENLKLLPPVPFPGKIVCLGLN